LAQNSSAVQISNSIEEEPAVQEIVTRSVEVGAGQLFNYDSSVASLNPPDDDTAPITISQPPLAVVKEIKASAAEKR
jgi:hypothetical protein